MTILSAQTIRARNIIEPFSERTKENGMTYGLGPASYDVRAKETATLAPGASALLSTIEHFTMPDDVLARVHPKSTWARQGVTVGNVVFDPGWTGHATLRIENEGDETVVIHSGMPLAQVVFELLDEPTEAPYVGKYSDQPSEPVAAILEAEPEPAPAPPEPPSQEALNKAFATYESTPLQGDVTKQQYIGGQPPSGENDTKFDNTPPDPAFQPGGSETYTQDYEPTPKAVADEPEEEATP